MAEILVRSKAHETWYHNRWRPSVGWTYIIICIFDFMIAPILWAVLQLQLLDATAITPWEPLTLQSGGLFHFAMMAIVGVTSYGRTKEKIEKAMNGNKSSTKE